MSGACLVALGAQPRFSMAHKAGQPAGHLLPLRDTVGCCPPSPRGDSLLCEQHLAGLSPTVPSTTAGQENEHCLV